jgi:hypothetical protein
LTISNDEATGGLVGKLKSRAEVQVAMDLKILKVTYNFAHASVKPGVVERSAEDERLKELPPRNVDRH